MDTQESITIPGYQIEQEIGRGGMATVYRAVQESLERTVALKVMTPREGADPSGKERFIKEGKIVAKLDHPNIVTVYDIGVVEPHYYMAMKYVAGGALSDRLCHGLNGPESLRIVTQIGEALGYAHAQGYVHRDIKPGNILFQENGTAVLSDFGIAKAISAGTQLTGVGLMVGTPDYMSPEQLVGRDLDARSDLYSLGIVLYEMLTKSKPFVAEDWTAAACMRINEPPPPLPQQLAIYQPLLDRLLAKEPEERFLNARGLIEYIERTFPETGDQSPFSSGATVAATLLASTGTSHVEPKNRPGGVGRRVYWGAGAGLSAVSVAALGYVLLSGDPLNYVEETTPAQYDSNGGEVDPQPPAVALSPAQQERVSRLLEAAEAHMAVGWIRKPEGSNAFEAYEMVLELDPENSEALQGMQRIERHLAIKQGE